MGCGGSKDTNTAAQKRRDIGNNNTTKNGISGKGQGGKAGQKGGANKSKKNQQPILEKGYKKRIRENLRHAAAGNDIDELERCMVVFVNNNMEDGGDYTEAERRMEFLQIRKEIKDACMRNHPEVLDKAIHRVNASQYKRQLKPYLDRAHYLKQHQDELDTFRHDVSNMDQACISEIRSYHHPPDGVHETMIATYMIIGYPEDHLVDWTEITALMGRYGKDSLKREVTMVDPKAIDQSTALRARKYLGQYSLEEVRSVSSGAAAFYVWSSQMVGKQDGGKKSSTTTPTKKLRNSGVKNGNQNNKAPSTPSKSIKDSPNKQQPNKAKAQNNTQNNKNNSKNTKKG